MTVFRPNMRVIPIIDDRVPVAAQGRVYVVTKVNPKNVKAAAEDGGRGINFDKELLVEATPENIALHDPRKPRPVEPIELFDPGDLVTLKRAHGAWGIDTPLVVFAERAGKVNVTALGGAQGRYLRVPSSGLVRRDLDWLKGVL